MKQHTLFFSMVLLFAPFLLFAGGTQEKSGSQQMAGGKIGGTVSVLAVWGGQELDIFNALIKPFEQQTGVSVQYEGTRNLDAVLTTRVAAGNPPDLAGLPNPGKMAELARQGKLVDLSGVLDKLMSESQGLVDKGITPWAIGLESGSASGWVGTDWIENIFLRMYGPQKYKEWYEGKLPWTSPEVKTAWQT